MLYELAKAGSYACGFLRHNSTLIDTHSLMYGSHLVNCLLSYRKSEYLNNCSASSAKVKLFRDSSMACSYALQASWNRSALS